MSKIKHVDLDTLSNVIKAIPSNIFFKDTNLNYVFSSHIWEQVDSGGDEDFDIYGKSDRDIRKDIANVDNVEKADRKIMDTGVGTRYTIESVVDGHLQYLELVKEPVKDDDGNIIGIVGLINDVTAVTKEMRDMLENEKAYRDAMKEGALLSFEVNLSRDLLEDDLMECVDGREYNLLEIIGMEAPCKYSDMVHKYANTILNGPSRQEYTEFHDINYLLDLYNRGQREIVRESKLNVNGVDGNVVEIWTYETVLLMHNTEGDITAFFTINDITEQRKKEEEVRLQLEENVREAERVANMKSDFLANMSHEIRTPMNAVIGMAELSLREDLPDAAREYINQIKNSGIALLNIINDILDFSKIESGKMEIIKDDFNPASVTHEISNVLLNRIGDKELELIEHINPELPVGLYGDSTRIRQVLINFANNAIKFTEKGYVSTEVDFEKINSDEIMLKVSVEDTGIGIRKEDMDKIFMSFQQVDSKRNRNIEGTGLGLAICSQLVELMDGTISVSSEYGKGSVFSFAIPLKVTDWTPCIRVEKSNEKEIAVYFSDTSELQIINKLIAGLNVEAHSYESIEEIEARRQNLSRGKELYVLTDYYKYGEEVKKFADTYSDIKLMVLYNQKTEVSNSGENVHFVKQPLSTIGIGTALNDEDVHIVETESFVIDFVAPDAKVLIVDDNEVNLAVAEGLVAPLKMQVQCATGGKKALELLEKEKYDLIFMDHMMPELDGVETTRIIRKLHPEYDDIPIIALSANALAGAKEMFLAEGMNDFVSKPVELKEIVTKIRQWLSKEKIIACDASESGDVRENVQEEQISIADLDVDKAISMLGNKELYLTIIRRYMENIKENAAEILRCEQEEDIKTYTICVHALKSSSRQIGATELADMAAELEKCGNDGDVVTIHNKTGALLEKYTGYYDQLSSLFEAKEDANRTEIKPEAIIEYLDKLLEATDNLDLDAMEEISEKMDTFLFEGEDLEYSSKLKKAVSNIDVDGVAEIISAWKAHLTQ